MENQVEDKNEIMNKSVNLALYEAMRAVPNEAQRTIEAGRLKGKTDINPMWRIKTLTEQFGPAGFGWYTETKGKWIERNEKTGEAVAYVDILLYIKVKGEWSKPIEGTGGSMFITNESRGPYTDDDAYKKAYTDAISVACKALGVGADVYWDKDPTKYSAKETPQDTPQSKKDTKSNKDTKKQTNEQEGNSAKATADVKELTEYLGRLKELLNGVETITLDQADRIAIRDYGTGIENLTKADRETLFERIKEYIGK